MYSKADLAEARRLSRICELLAEKSALLPRAATTADRERLVELDRALEALGPVEQPDQTA